MKKELLHERKKMIYDFICDELYVPRKAKEMAIVLNASVHFYDGLCNGVVVHISFFIDLHDTV